MDGYSYLGTDLSGDVDKELKKLSEWAEEYNVKIIDPDGFDRKDPYLFDRLFSREEFNKGLIKCSISGKK